MYVCRLSEIIKCSFHSCIHTHKTAHTYRHTHVRAITVCNLPWDLRRSWYCLYTFTCKCLHPYACKYKHIYVRMHACTYIRIYIYIYICTYIHIKARNVFTLKRMTLRSSGVIKVSYIVGYTSHSILCQVSILRWIALTTLLLGSYVGRYTPDFLESSTLQFLLHKWPTCTYACT